MAEEENNSEQYGFGISVMQRQLSEDEKSKLIKKLVSPATSYEDFVKGMEFVDGLIDTQKQEIIYKATITHKVKDDKLEYVAKRALVDGDDDYERGFKDNPYFDKKIEIFKKLLKEHKGWDEIGIEVWGNNAAGLIRQAQSGEQVDKILDTDKEFAEKKWDKYNYAYLNERFHGSKIDTDDFIKYLREHETTRLYMVAAANPHTSAEKLQYILEQTAKTDNEPDRADVLNCIYDNPNLKPEHYNALIDCFKDKACIVDYAGKGVLKLEGMSLAQLQRFAKIVNKNETKFDENHTVLKSEIAKKKIELQKANDKPKNKTNSKVVVGKLPGRKGPDLKL